MNIIETENNYIAGTYKRFPIEIISGKGCIATDTAGKDYIDLASGIAVNTFGYADQEWTDAVSAQLSTLQHTSIKIEEISPLGFLQRCCVKKQV